MKTLIHIFTQYFENGKGKGTVMFSVNADTDNFMYAEDQCILAIKTLLKEKSNDYVTYEYLSHELIFHGVEALDDTKFAYEVVRECRKAFEPNSLN